MTDYFLPQNPDAEVLIERMDDAWWAGCQERFCGAEESYPAFSYNQARRWRTAHRKEHAAGTQPVGRTFRIAWEQHIGCMCDYGGRDTCPLHINGQDVDELVAKATDPSFWCRP